MSYDLRGWKLYLTTLGLALGLLLPGCGGSRDTSKIKDAPVLEGVEKQSTSSSATAPSGSLTISLTAIPMRANTDSPVKFNLIAYAPHATGAFGYQLHYGDGTRTAQESVPLICIEGEGVPKRHTWHLVHRYEATGRYRASVIVYVNCTSDHATATVAVSIA
jgi:hypothetical protein